jgi:phage FluMu gp28-like protein
MERIAIVSILSVLLVQLTAARATAEGDYKKICRVSENLRVLDDSADANSCRTIAVDSQAQEYQIGCRDSENTSAIIVTAPFHITDKAARVTSSKLEAYAQNTATPDQFAKCAKAWGSR